MVELTDGRAIAFVGHGGSVAGYKPLGVQPESGLGVVLIKNYNRGVTNLGRAGRELLRELVETDPGAG